MSEKLNVKVNSLCLSSNDFHFARSWKWWDSPFLYITHSWWQILVSVRKHRTKMKEWKTKVPKNENPRDWWHFTWLNTHKAVCHPLQPVHRDETQENNKKSSWSDGCVSPTYSIAISLICTNYQGKLFSWWGGRGASQNSGFRSADWWIKRRNNSLFYLGGLKGGCKQSSPKEAKVDCGLEQHVGGATKTCSSSHTSNLL